MKTNPGKAVTTVTTADTDRTKAAVTQKGNERIVHLKGPLSEILRRALNIIYAKDSEYEGNYSMEDATPETSDQEFDDLVYTVLNTQITDQTVSEFAELSSAAKEEGKAMNLIILSSRKTDDEADTSLVDVLTSLAESEGVAVYLKPDEFFV